MLLNCDEDGADSAGRCAKCMFCICNRYRECEIRDLAAGGAKSPEEAYSVLGSGPRCGRCLPFARQVMDEAAAAETVPR